VAIWNAVTGAYLRTVSLPSQQPAIQDLAFSPDDKRLIAVTASPGAYQWDVPSGRGSVITQVPADDPRAGSIDVAVSADGTAVAEVNAGDDGVEVRSTASGAVVAELADPNQESVVPVASGAKLDGAVALSANGKVLSVADISGNVYIWDVPGRRVTRVIQYGYNPYVLAGQDQPPVTLSPAGNLVLLARDSSGAADTLWSTASGAQVRPAGSRWASDTTGSVPPVFSPDGRVIVAESGSGAADFWDAATGAYLGRVALPGGGSPSIEAVGPGGRELVTDDGAGHPYLVSSPY
jgi:WD40 repeat protein